MPYDCFATPDGKNTCNLDIKNPFLATITLQSRTTKKALSLLKSSVLNYQSILYEENGSDKDFELGIISCDESLEISGNLEYFSICFLQCRLIEFVNQKSFVETLNKFIQQTNLTYKQQKQLQSYKTNVKKALDIINFNSEHCDDFENEAVPEKSIKKPPYFFNSIFSETSSVSDNSFIDCDNSRINVAKNT